MLKCEIKFKAMTKEADVKENVKRILKHYNIFWYMPVPNGMGAMGIPDFLCCMHGMFVAIETKYGANKPSPMQALNIGKIRAAGGVALVIWEDSLHTLYSDLGMLCARHKAEKALEQ